MSRPGPYLFAMLEGTSVWPWQFGLEVMNPRHFPEEWRETVVWCHQRFGRPHNQMLYSLTRPRRVWAETEYRILIRSERAAMEFRMRWC